MSKLKTQEITITVSGSSGVGKSRVAAFIYKFLESQDFKTSIKFKDELYLEDVIESLDDAIPRIKKNVKILIEENTTYRSTAN
jgi:uridine kinase